MALKASKSYIDGIDGLATTNTKKEESVDAEADALTEKVELDARTRIYRNTVTRLEQAKRATESSNADVDESMTMTMSNKEILAAVNMKGGKYMMDEDELSPKQKAYRKFFNGALKKHGASSPSELEGDKKKKFFDYVKANWKG